MPEQQTPAESELLQELDAQLRVGCDVGNLASKAFTPPNACTNPGDVLARLHCCTHPAGDAYVLCAGCLAKMQTEMAKAFRRAAEDGGIVACPRCKRVMRTVDEFVYPTEAIQ